MPDWVRKTVWIAGALLLVTINLIIFAAVARYLLPVLLPFFVAAIVALRIEPAVEFLQRRVKLPRGVSVFVMMIVLFGTLGSLFSWALLRLVAELVQLSLQLPSYIRTLEQTAAGLIEESLQVYTTLPPAVANWLNDFLLSLVVTLESQVRSAVNTSLGLLSGVPVLVLVIIVTLLATYFFSRDREAIVGLWMRSMPKPFGEHSLLVGRQGFGAFIRFLRAQFILVSITAIITLVGLLIIDVPYAVTLALLTGLFDFIPILGPSTIFIPWILWSFLFGSQTLALQLLCLYVILFLVRGFLEAKVVAMNLGVHPLAVLAAMFIGLNTLGFLGLVLGPITLIIVQAAVKAGMVAWKVN
ncbi:MAG: sporulation integral membrane protein YtvI [Bacillota bacterium]|nr:sporulation integral membrane protein YtvI [Bacillota bacterium]